MCNTAAAAPFEDGYVGDRNVPDLTHIHSQREKERATDRKTERETDRQKDREGEREEGREREGWREGGRERASVDGHSHRVP